MQGSSRKSLLHLIYDYVKNCRFVEIRSIALEKNGVRVSNLRWLQEGNFVTFDLGEFVSKIAVDEIHEVGRF